MKNLCWAILSFLWSNYAYSGNTECICSSSEDLTIKQVVDADLLFRGVVIDQQTIKFPELGYQYVSTFKIVEVLKGVYENDTVDIIIGYGNTCDPVFMRNTEYLVLNKYNPSIDMFITSVCIGSSVWDESSKWNKASSREKRMIHEFQNGKFERSWWNQFHQLIAKGRIIGGKPEGKWEFFNRNQKTESGWFENGKKQGDWITYANKFEVCDGLGLPMDCNLEDFKPPHPEGWISKRTPFKDGVIHGTVLIYHESGCILSESIFENGVRTRFLPSF